MIDIFTPANELQIPQFVQNASNYQKCLQFHLEAFRIPHNEQLSQPGSSRLD